MKNASANLKSFLNAARTNDAPLQMADCYTITLTNGGIGYFTSYDVNVVYNGNTFIAESLLIQGLKCKVAVGLEVDRQQITIAAWPGATINGNPWMQAIREGALDGALIQRDRVFFSSSFPGGIDGVTLFKGFVSTVDAVGRTSAQVTIASPLVILDYDMPRNLFSATCLHTLYDSGCGLVAGDFSLSANAGAGSTTTVINFSGADQKYAQGSMQFQSGGNAGVRSTVKSIVSGVSATLLYPLPETPATGDSFIVFEGCDHTSQTCVTKFNNVVHFRGFPYVPPPEFAF
jgi:uncharacterized phage protein (TIGR02218 family)